MHKQFFISWTWKREHLPDKLRFKRPYTYEFDDKSKPLTLKQSMFKHMGFASTVWDSSIVVSKYFEKSGLVMGRRCLDLSSGCGLVSLVMDRCGASSVMATDMKGNLELLDDNCQANASGRGIVVAAHLWGSSIDPPIQPGNYDLITACDLLYITDSEVITALVKSLTDLLAPDGEVILAYGRNRGGEESFREISGEVFSWEEVCFASLHHTYRCSDVKVVSLRFKDKYTEAEKEGSKKRRSSINGRVPPCKKRGSGQPTAR